MYVVRMRALALFDISQVLNCSFLQLFQAFLLIQPFSKASLSVQLGESVKVRERVEGKSLRAL